MGAIVANTGSNNWNTNGAWVGSVQPTAADDVTIPATAVVTIPAATTVQARSVTEAAGGTLAFAATTSVINIGDGTAGTGNVAWSFSATGTLTLTGIGTINFISTSATVQTIATGGLTMPNITINGTGSSYQLTDANTVGATATVTLTKGTLDTNGQTCSWGLFNANNSNTKSLVLGASAISISGNTFTDNWSLSIAGTTLSAASSTITMTRASSQFSSNGGTYGTLIFNGGGDARLSNSASLTFSTLTITGTAVKTDRFIIASSSVTITGIFTCNGNSTINRILIISSIFGTARTITAATVTASNIDIQDVIGAGAATWDLSAITGNSGDAQGNSGVTFTSAATQFWFSNTGNWSDSTKWFLATGGTGGAGRIPLPQDNIRFDSGSFTTTARVVTMDMPRVGRDIDWTGTTNSPSWTISSLNCNFYGSVTQISTVLTSGNSGKLHNFDNRSATTFTSAGVPWRETIIVRTIGSTFTLQDDLNLSASTAAASVITLVNGTLNANNHNVTVQSFASVGALIRTLTMGSGTWSLFGTGTVWNVSNSLTLNANTSTIAITDVSATSKTFQTGGLTYNILSETVAGSTGSLSILSSTTGATINTINFSDALNARTLIFQNNRTVNVTTFNVQGTVSKLMTLQSDSAGTAFTLSKPSGNVICDYLSIQDSTATGGASWYAGANSTSVSGNTGWIFTAPPKGGTMLMMGVG